MRILLLWKSFHFCAHLVSFDDVFELTSLFLLDVWRQVNSGSSQAVILHMKKV